MADRTENSDVRNIKLDRWNQGDKIFAAKLDQPRQVIENLLGGVTPPQGLGATGNNTSKISRFRVKEVFADYVTAQPYIGNGDTVLDTVFKVAKPWMLRRTPFDSSLLDPPPLRAGLKYIYTESIDKRIAIDEEGNEEAQFVLPSYIEDDQITVASSVRGGTGATFENNDGKNEPITLLDMSTRVWASDPNPDEPNE